MFYVALPFVVVAIKFGEMIDYISDLRCKFGYHFWEVEQEYPKYSGLTRRHVICTRCKYKEVWGV